MKKTLAALAPTLADIIIFIVAIHAGAALSPYLLATMAVLMIAGAGWVLTLSTFNVAVQMAAPRWVVARALSMYQMSAFGGLAAGSAAWGALAGMVGVPRSFGLSALAIALGRVLTWRARLPVGAKLDLAPAPIWPDPEVLRPFESDRGPALVTIEYLIDPADSDAFSRAMGALETIRLRDGAIRWGLWDDVAEPGRFLESFVVESWLEHLRQHERITADDKQIQEALRALHRGERAPVVRHFVGGGDAPVTPLAHHHQDI